MSRRRNLSWLRAGVSRIVNFNDGQPDQDFAGTSDDAYADVDYAINSAYEEAFHDLLTQADPELFLVYEDITWPSGQLTLRLPEFLDVDMIYAVDDITAANPGERLRIFQRGLEYGPTIFPLTGTTLQWGSAGAPSDKTLRVFFYPVTKDMKAESDEPVYIPYRFRRLLHWDAAILLRDMANDNHPRRWAERRERIWNQMMLAASEGRPIAGNQARIHMHDLHDDFF